MKMNAVPVLLLFLLSVRAYTIEEVERDDDFRRRGIDDRRIEGRGIEGRGVEGRGVEGRGIEGRGIEGRGIEGRGIEGRGIEGRGIEGRGIEGRRIEGREDRHLEDFSRGPKVRNQDEYREINRQINHRKSSVDNVPRGIVPTVFTPMHHDGSVDLGAIKPYAEFLIRQGIKAVLVGGTAGEAASQDIRNRMKVVTEWVKIARATGLHIMCQVGAQNFEDVIHETKHCVKIGVDSIMTLPEIYFKPRTVDDLVFFVSEVAREAPHLPVFYYHNPNYTDVTVNQVAFVTEASKRIPNFKGIKFSSVNMAEMEQTQRALRHDQVLYNTPEVLFASGAIIGIDSLITPVLNMLPQLSRAILDAVEKGEIQKAMMLQKKMSYAADAVKAEGGINAWKATMEIITGLKMGPPHLPLRPISHAARVRIASVLKACGVI